MTSVEVSFEPLPDPLMERLAEEDRRQIEVVTERFRESPASQVEELEQLVANYPHLPKLHNFLSVAYKYAGKNDEARRVIRETYERFPNYLFGKTNFALELLLQGRAEEIPDVFGGPPDLTALYPHRRVFHVSEVVSFFSVLSLYLFAVGQEEESRMIYENVLCDIDPENPLVKRVADLFSRNPLRRLMARAEVRPRKSRRASGE